MTARRRYALLLAGGFFLLLVLIFQQIIIANVVLPVATVIWALLRIFVFSIDQHVFWWLLIGVLLLVPLIRELRKDRPYYGDPDFTATSNPWLTRIDSWRGSILADVRETESRSRVRHDLAWLLTGLYATGRQQSADDEVQTALQRSEIDLPDALRAFLWPAARPPRPPFFRDPAGFIRHTMGSLRAAAVLRVRRLTGREAAEYYQAIELALAHMETALEMRNDDTPYTP